MINAPISVQNALLSGNFKYANLVSINLGDAYDVGSDLVLYYTDYVAPVTYNGNTYTPNNSLATLDGISRKASVGSDKIELSFSIADEVVVQAIRSERYVNKPTIIERVIIENNTVLDDFAIPIRTAWGLAHSISGGDEERVCTLTIDSVLGDLNGDNGWFAINSSHQRRHLGDQIMKWSSTVMTDEQRKRYTTNFNGVINESIKPPALPVIYGHRNAKLIPILQLKHRKTHTTYRHYYTTWIYVVSIGEVVNADVQNIKKDGEKFQYEVITGTREDAGGWSLRVMKPSENTVSIDANNSSLLWFKGRMDTAEIVRFNDMIGRGLTLLFIKNRNRDDWISSPPELTMPVQGIRVFDPRTGLDTTTATRNPALQYADFLRSTKYGAGKRNILVSDNNIALLANHFDNLPESVGNAGINDIKFDVQMDTGNSLVENMNIWMESLRLYTSDYYGEFIVNAQTIQNSVWDIDEYDDQVIGTPEFESGEFTERLNQLTYSIKQLVPDLSPEAEVGDLVEVDVEATFPEDGSPLYNQWLSEDSNIQNYDSNSLEYVTILEQAFYWTMVDARISRQPRTLMLPVGSYGWLMEVGDVITFSSDIMEETLTEWRIDEVSEDDDGSVELSCIAYASEFYSPDPAAIPDPVASATLQTKGVLPPITGFSLIFENGQNKLTWDKIDSSEVAWYAVEIWLNETQLVEQPKVLEPPYSLGALGVGNYIAYLTPFAPTIEGGETTLAFSIVQIDQPTFSVTSSNFEILINPTYVNQSAETLYEVEYSTDVTFATGVINLGTHTGSITITGLASNTNYGVRVRVVVPAGVSGWTSVTVATSNDGTIYNDLAGFDITSGRSVFQASIYRRSTTSLTAPTGGSFNFDTLVLTPPTGWSQTPQGGAGELYVSTGLANVLGTVGTDSTIPWSTPEVLLQGGLGLDGKSVYQGALYQRTFSPSVPTKPADNSAEFDFTNNNYITIPSGWFATIPATTGGYVWVTYATFSITGATGTDATQTWSTPVTLGIDGESALSTFTYNVYRRSASAITTAPTGGSYNFSTNAITTPTNWSASIPSGNDPVYASTTTASITGATGTDTSLTYTTPVIIARDGVTPPDATDGNTVATLTIYRRSASAITTAPTGGSYNFTNNVFTPPTGWSASIPSGTDPVYSASGLALIIEGNTGTDSSIPWTVPNLAFQNGGKGDTGNSVYQAAIYRRASTAPTKPADNSASYNFTNNILTPPTNWFGYIPDGQLPVYSSTATFVIVGDTGSSGTQTWTTPTLTIENSVSSYTYDVFIRSTTAPSPAPTGGSYDFTNNAITPPTNWFSSAPSGNLPLWSARTTATIVGSTGTDTSLTYQAPVKVAESPVSGYFTHTNGTTVTRTQAGAWSVAVNAPQTSTFSFVRNGDVIASGTLTWVLQNTDGLVNVFDTLSLLTGEAVTLSLINDNTPNATVIITHTATGTKITANFNSVINGEDGDSYTGTIEYYKLTNSATAPTIASGSWLTTPQTPTSSNRYLWNYNSNTRTIGTPINSPVSLITQYVKDGKGITGITEEYQLGTSPTVAPTGSWSSTFSGAGAISEALPYMWNRTTIAYTEGANTVVETMIAARGTNGTAGVDGTTGSFVHNSGTVAKKDKNGVWTPAIFADQSSDFTFSRGGSVIASGTVLWEVQNTSGDIFVFGVIQNEIGNVTLTRPTIAGQVVPITVTHDDSGATITATFTNSLDGVDGDNAKTLTVNANSQTMSFNKAGVAFGTNPVIITANPQNLNGTLVWTTVPVNQGSASGNTYTLPSSVFASHNSVLVTATQDGLSDSTTITKLQDGSDVVSVTMSNQNHTFAANATGGGIDVTGSGTEIRVYEGATELFYTGTSAFPATVTPQTWKIITRLGFTGTISTGSPSDSGTFATAPSINSMGSDQATLTFRVVGQTAKGTPFDISVVQSFSKSKQGVAGVGIDGLNNAIVYLYRRALSPPAVSNVTSTYTFATKLLTGFDPNWSLAIPTNSTQPIYVIAATASSNGATDTIASTEWSAPAVLASNGVNGLNSATVAIYRRLNTVPTLPTLAVTYTFSSGALTAPNNSWTTTIPEGTDPLYISTATAASSSSTDSILASEWSAPAVLVENGDDGASVFTLLATVDANSDEVMTPNSIEKIIGGGSWNCGAYSAEAFYACSTSFKLSPSTSTMAGLSENNGQSSTFTTINFAIFATTANDLYIYESGVNILLFTAGHAADNIYTVTCDGLKVTYYRNGVLLYTSLKTLGTTPLRFDCSLNMFGGKISNITLGAIARASQPWLTYHDSTLDAVPALPTGSGVANGWSRLSRPSANWMSTKISESVSTGVWGEPIQIAGRDGAVGPAGADAAGTESITDTTATLVQNSIAAQNVFSLTLPAGGAAWRVTGSVSGSVNASGQVFDGNQTQTVVRPTRIQARLVRGSTTLGTIFYDPSSTTFEAFSNYAFTFDIPSQTGGENFHLEVTVTVENSWDIINLSGTGFLKAER